MKTFLSTAMVFALALSFASVALAQAPTSGVGGVADPDAIGTVPGLATDTDLVTIIMGLVNWVAWFVGLIAVLAGLYAGILFITAGGNAETVTKARNILLYAIVGIAVAVLSFGLVAISRSFVGI